MAVTCSAEFDRSPAGKASLGLVVIDLLDAGRQFAVTPTFDPPGFILSWPGAPIVTEAEPEPA
jgi:hypothetical protein